MEVKSRLQKSTRRESAHSSATYVPQQTTSVKIFNFEKTGRKPPKNLKQRKPENLIRRAGGLKQRKDLKYASFESLYELWCGYYGALLEQMKKADERLLKADYHGCLLRVEDALNKSQIGQNGIVIHESKYTFQMITRKDKVIVIPKEGATFQFVLNGQVFTLFGDALRLKPFLRGKKQKSQLTLPFFLK
ncbi:ribonuclease P protein subunit p29 [Ditylenchus destructor]|uniref:Ribonuclease P protein subunit p29 n=1 Tax=Ditylenchus destructor TaxID=166010 RepID=A0AAD4NKX5_9BILA|nr:ribonuclease P protein subunit p29 [Ditylenchus destructor]